MNRAGSLAGRHAFVTGASRGIGAAIARQLAERGARVTLIGRDETTLQQASLTLPAGSEAQIAVADVTQAADVARAFASARARFGPVDVLVNNAGAAASAPLAKTSDALWESMLAVNVSGAFFCSREAAPAMQKAGFGRIVNVASTAGLAGFAYVSAYVAAKHALVGLTRALALEFAGTGVTVNAVCPGFVETAIVRDALKTIVAATGRTEAQARAELLRSNPIDRFLSPDEVAAAVCALIAGERSGEALLVTGGEVPS